MEYFHFSKVIRAITSRQTFFCSLMLQNH